MTRFWYEYQSWSLPDAFTPFPQNFSPQNKSFQKSCLYLLPESGVDPHVLHVLGVACAGSFLISSLEARAILLLWAAELELAPVALRYILLGIWKWKSLDICLLELKSFLLLENYIQYNKLRLNSKQQYSSIKNNQGLLLLLISLGVVIVLCAMFRPLPQYDI